MNLNSKRYFGAALIIAALLPLTHGAELAGTQNTYMQQSSARQATVIDHAIARAPRTSDTRPEVFLVVEFVDDNGTRRQSKTNVASYPPSNAIGEQVVIRVHHTQPNDVRLASFSGLWLESAFYLIPGLLTFALGMLLFLKKNRPTQT